jgi:hypothetical protein
MNILIYVNDDFLMGLIRNMSKVLKLKDFQWIETNTEKADGYYSFKGCDWEITIDWTYRKCWTVSVCNKFEEALEEYGCVDESEALKIANKIYRSFVNKML